MTRLTSHPVIWSTVLVLAAIPAGCGGNTTASKTHDGHDDHDDPKSDPQSEPAGEIHLSPKQLEAARIEVQAAGPGVVPQTLTLTAAAEANLDAQAHVTPRVSGLVRAIHKRLGDAVKKGDLICEIDSVELGKHVSTYLSAKARLEASREILAQETILLARSVQIAQTVFAREAKLKEREITTLRPYYAAEQALAQAKLAQDRRRLQLTGGVKEREIELHAAEEQLEILGRTSAEIGALSGEGVHHHGRYRIRAPRDGVVIERHITENEFVDTSSKLFRIVDLSTVWILAAVYEKDLRFVRKGQAVDVRLPAFPNTPLRGTVDLVEYQVDPKTRTCRIRVVLQNKPLSGWKEPFPIRPGMFGTVRVVVRQQRAPVVIPEAAVVHEGEQTFVFVAVPNEAGAYLRRRVELGARSADVVEVTAGLEAGEQVVIRGAFTLKSVARQGELGGGHSH